MTVMNMPEYANSKKHIEETIEVITNAIQCEKMTCEQDKALAIAQKAFEKQIPKKPVDVCTPVVTWGLCPVCKGELNKLGGRPNRVFSNMNYCPDCGQAIDWSK